MSLIRKSLKITGLALVGGTAILWALDHFQNKLPEELRGAEDLERRTIDVTIKQLIADLENFSKENPGNIVRRDAHAKSHGCVKATFRVHDDLPEHLKVGLYAKGGSEYKAWIRYSNGAFKPRNDIEWDGRGMSLKILDTPPTARASDTGAVDQFDMLLVNHPEFFAPDPLDYYDFVKAGILVGKPGALKRYFLPNLNPFSWRIRQFFIAQENSSRPISSPLTMRYFSMSPYAFGAKQQIKYSAKACDINHEIIEAKAKEDNPNYLRENLKKHLDQAPACFTLMVQVNDGSVSVEDASVHWSEDAMPFQEIADIKIPKQDFAKPYNDNFCEHSDFNPARTPEEFKALGGINRLRDEVYSAISAYRHQRNDKSVPDPNLAWDQE